MTGPGGGTGPAADRRPLVRALDPRPARSTSTPTVEATPQPVVPNSVLAVLLDATGLGGAAPLLDAAAWLPELFLEWLSADLFAPAVEAAEPDASVAETGAAVTVLGQAAASPPPPAPGPTPATGEAEPRSFDVAPAPGPPAPEGPVEEPPTAPAVPGEASAVSGGPPTTAEGVRARVDSAVAALPRPTGPDAARTRAPLDATTGRILTRTGVEVEALRQPPASIVGRRPGHRRQPVPDPGPIRTQIKALHAEMGKPLAPATLPPVTRSPRGTLPDLTRPVLTDLEIRAVGLGTAAIAQLTSGTDPASVAEREKLEEIRKSLGARTAAAPRPDAGGAEVAPAPVPLSVPVVDEPVVGAGLTQQQRELFALVVGDLRADPAGQAGQVLRAVRLAHPHFPGGALDRAFPDLTAGLLPEATTAVAAEADGLAQALALAPDQVDEAVRLRREQVEHLQATALGAVADAGDHAATTAGGADTRKRTAAAATAAGVARTAAADRTPQRPPSRVQQRAEQAMAEIREPVATELARLDEQRRLRERAVDDAIRAQVSAIRLAQTTDEVALRPAPGARGTTQDRLFAGDVLRWANREVDALENPDTGKRTTLTAAARDQTEILKGRVRAAAADAITALRAWGSEHVKATDAWWVDLDARLATWSAEALDAGKQWADQQGQASRIALGQDLESIERISAILSAGATEEADQYVKRLDGEARAVVQALSAGGGADLTAALSAGIRERIRTRNATAWADALERAVLTMPIAENFTALESLLTIVQPGWKLEDVTDRIHKAVTRWRGHDEEAVFDALSGLSPLAARLLPWFYEKKIGQSLDDALLGHGHVGSLNTDEMDTAHQMLRGERVEGAIGAIHSALSGPGAEMGAVNKILRALSPVERTRVVTEYQLRYHRSLEAELEGQWSVSQSEVDESMAIGRSDLTGASAIALERSVRTVYGDGGELGPAPGTDDRTAVLDRDAAAEVYAQIRRDVEAEGTQKRWTSDQIEAEITVRSQELGARFDKRAADQWWVRNQPPGTSATDAAFALASPAGRDLLHGLATNDLVGIDVARVQLEDEGLWAGDAALNGVFRDQASRSLVEVQRDMGPIVEARTEAVLRREEAGFGDAEQRVNRRMELERENAALLGRMADDRTRTRMDELGNLYEIKSGRTLTAMVEDNMSFTAKEEALARVKQRGVLTNYQKLRYAIEGLGTDMPMLRATLATMDRNELAEASRRWRRDHHGESLIGAVEDDTSGREQFELVDMATYGAPQTAAEVVEAAERKLGRDQASATLLGAASTRRESAYAAEQVALLRTRLNEMRRSGSDSDAQWRASTAFDIAVDRANTAIELQRQALDEITDLLANAAAIVTAVVVGAALAPFTAGGSAAVAAAVISSVLATAVSVGIKQAMKGSAYGRGELATDLAIGAVDALVSALTAGLGHGLLGRAAGAASTARSLKFAQALGKLGTVGRAAAASRGLVARQASRFAFLEGLDQSKNFAIRMVGRGTAQLIEQGIQAIPSSFLGSVLDESVLTDPRGVALVFERTVSGTLHSTAMGLGLAAAHHVGTLGWHASVHTTKALVEGVRVMAMPDVRLPTGEVLAHATTPVERLAEFREWRRANPAGTVGEFVGQRRAALVESWQLASEQHQQVREARAELLSGLPPAERGRYADLPIRSVGDAEFARLGGPTGGDAHLLVREGQAVLLVREGAAPGAVAALLPAVQERVFPGTFGMTVEAALPRSLRDTPIRIDTTLPHDEIRVVPIPETGPIVGVQVLVGPGAHPIDVGLHAGEITRIRRWTGRLGEARQALAHFTERFGLAPVHPEQRTRFEAAGEVRKLGPLIEERMRRMATARDPAEAAGHERRVRQLLAQQERARRVLTGELQAEPRGYVAQEGEPPAPAPQPSPADAVQALSKLGPRRAELVDWVNNEQLVLDRLRGPLEPFEQRLADRHQEIHEQVPDSGVGEAHDTYTSDHRAALHEALEALLGRPGLAPDVRGHVAALRRDLRAYELKLNELTPKLDAQERRVRDATEAFQRGEADIARWMGVLKADPHAAAVALNDRRTLMGVPLSPLLPRALAPDGYFPHLLEGESLAKQVQHVFGLHAEAHLANRVAEDFHDTVVEFGDKVGTNGADVTSVDGKGRPTLWDSKYRSSGMKHEKSKTFTVEGRLRKAAEQARQAVLRNPDARLSPQQVAEAVRLLVAGDFVTYSVTSADASTFHTAVKMEFRKFKLVKSDQMGVPWPR